MRSTAAREIRAYLTRKAQAQQVIIDSVPVFSKRYGTAVDELEEIEDLLGTLEKT